MKRILTLFVAATLIFALSGCGKSKKALPVSGEKVESVSAPLLNTDGKEIGKVSLSEDSKGVTILIEASEVPAGMHGVHIHETGVCTPPGFESAGGHFNPEGKEHGFDNPKGFHLGDLPNIEVKEDGKVEAQVTTADLTLKPGQKHSLLDADGSALVIHESADDYKTDPAGNSGKRIACAAFTTAAK